MIIGCVFVGVISGVVSVLAAVIFYDVNVLGSFLTFLLFSSLGFFVSAVILAARASGDPEEAGAASGRPQLPTGHEGFMIH